MNTTITNNSLPNFPQATNNPGNSASATRAGPTDVSKTALSNGDQLKLTDSARALQEAARMDDASPIDAKRVEQVRNALADGSYKIDAGRIADGLLAMDRQLGGTEKA